MSQRRAGRRGKEKSMQKRKELGSHCCQGKCDSLLALLPPTCLMKCSFLTCLEMYRMESAAFSRKAITIFSPSFACLYFCFPRNFDLEVVPFSSVSENE